MSTASRVLPCQPAARSTWVSHSQFITSAAKYAQSLASCSGRPPTFMSVALSRLYVPLSRFRRVACTLGSLLIFWIRLSRLPSV